MTRRRPTARFFKFILVVLLLGGGSFALFRILSVQTIFISGNETKTYDEIWMASGIAMGESLFTLDVTAAENRLRQDPYLDVIAVRVKFPSSVEIFVRERKIRALMEYYRGTTVLMDEMGLVLEARNIVEGDLGVPTIQGLSAGAVEVGKVLEVSDRTQLIAMQAVLDALNAHGAAGEILTINVANLDNLAMQTRGGISVELGDREDMEIKISWMLATLPQLEQGNAAGGVLNVSSLKYADYQPGAGNTNTPEDGASPTEEPVDETGDDAE